MAPRKAAPKAYSYIRFSSPEQARGDSLRRQTQLADEYAKRNGLALDDELTLRDLGVSAFRGDNAAVGALGAFRRAIESGLVPRGSLLLVEALDRISRKGARSALRILEEIIEGGVDVVTLSDNKRWSKESLDGWDFAMAWLLFMRGHEESRMKSERLKQAWIAKRERAARREIQTTRVPAWLKAVGSAAIGAGGAKLELIPERAKLVRRIFSMFLAGQGKAAIAEQFNREHIPTWGAGKGRNRAAHWHKTYVFKILTNPAVTGRFVPYVEEYHDESGKLHRKPQKAITDYYPRALDDATFERAQTLIRGGKKTNPRGKTVASLVAGLARCPKCGSTMTRIMKGAGNGAPRLICTKAKAGAGCEYHTVRLPDVEQELIERAEELTPPAIESNLDDEIEALRVELHELDDTIRTLIDTIERSPSPALSKRLAAREAERAKVQAAHDAVQARITERESNVVGHRAQRLVDALKLLRKDRSALPAANAALRECLSSITVNYDAHELLLQWRHGGGPTRIHFGLAEQFPKVA